MATVTRLPVRAPRATRTRKPNRRPGSCPPPHPTSSQLDFAQRLINADRATAEGISAALTALLGAPTPEQAAFLTELASP